MAGLPPLVGFVAKELAYESILSEGALLLIAALVFGGACFVLVAAVVGVAPFWAMPPREERDHQGFELASTEHEVSVSHWHGPVVLAGRVLAAGLGVGPFGTRV